MGHWMRGTGAVIVTASMLQSYTDIKNGVYDGYPISSTLSFAYKTYEAAQYCGRRDFGISATSSLTVNKAAWAKLPAALQGHLRRRRQGLVALADRARRGERQGAARAMAKKGMKIAEMPSSERRRWALLMPNIAQEWADALEKDGHPGRKVLKTYMDEVRALNVEIARQWDQRVGGAATATSMAGGESTAPKPRRLAHRTVAYRSARVDHERDGTLWIFDLMVLVYADVFMRYLFNAPITGVPLVITMSMIAIVFLQLPDALRNGRFIRNAAIIAGMLRARPTLGHALKASYYVPVPCSWPSSSWYTVAVLEEGWKANIYLGNRGDFTLPEWPFELLMVVGGTWSASSISASPWANIRACWRQERSPGSRAANWRYRLTPI